MNEKCIHWKFGVHTHTHTERDEQQKINHTIVYTSHINQAVEKKTTGELTENMRKRKKELHGKHEHS